MTGAADAVVVLGKEKRTDLEAKMFITGRKVRQTMHDIRFDDTKCQWEYVGLAEVTDKDDREQQEREKEYMNSKIREAVIQIARSMDKGDEPWKGRAGDLIEKALEFQIGLKESNRDIGGFLNKMQGMFMAYDYVLVGKIKNGTAPWIYKIYPQEGFENPFT